MGDNITCGTGQQCEATCPVMRITRDCPDNPLDAIEEVLKAVHLTSCVQAS